MHGLMGGWDWLWMSFVMAFWLIAVAAAVFALVRAAQRPPRGRA